MSGSSGYDDSVDYVAGLLEEAGLVVERQEFSFDSYTEISAALSLDGTAIETQTMSFSGSSAVVDGNLIGVDLDLGLGNASSSDQGDTEDRKDIISGTLGAARPLIAVLDIGYDDAITLLESGSGVSASMVTERRDPFGHPGEQDSGHPTP